MGGNSKIKSMETWKGGALVEKGAGKGLNPAREVRGFEGFAEGGIEAAGRYERWQRLAEQSDSGLQNSPGVRLLGSSGGAGGREPDLNGEAFFLATPIEGGEAVTVFCASPGFAAAPAPNQFLAAYEGARSEVYTNENGDAVIDIALRIHDPSAPGGSRVEIYTMLDMAARAGGFLSEDLRPLPPERVRNQSILVEGGAAWGG